MSEITYDDKIDLNVESTIANINKVTASDMNEIKSVVNTNADEVGDITTLTTTDKTSVVNAINEINQPTSLVHIGIDAPIDDKRVWFKKSKNLFDDTKASMLVNASTSVENNIITITTTNTTTNGNLFFRVKIDDNVLVNGKTYVLSYEPITNINRPFKLQLRNHDGSNANQPQVDSLVFDDTYSLFVVGNPFAVDTTTSVPAGSICVFKNVQVEEGSTATTYEPYIEQNLLVDETKFMANQLVNVGPTNQNDGRKVWFSKSKNLFNINDNPTRVEQCSKSVDNNILTQTNSGGYCRTEWAVSDLKIGSTYTFSCNFSNSSNSSLAVRIYDSANSTQIVGSSTITNASGKITLLFTATETAISLRIYSNTSSTTNTLVVSFSNIQLEQGENSTTYEPYINPNINVDNDIWFSKPMVLWRNTSPTSSFVSKTITLNDNLANYSYYEILTLLTTSFSNMVFSTGRLPTSMTKTRLSVPRHYLGIREVTTNGNQISIGDYLQYTTYGSTTSTNNNGTCIPYQVIGYK